MTCWLSVHIDKEFVLVFFRDFSSYKRGSCASVAVKKSCYVYAYTSLCWERLLVLWKIGGFDGDDGVWMRC